MDAGRLVAIRCGFRSFPGCVFPIKAGMSTGSESPVDATPARRSPLRLVGAALILASLVVWFFDLGIGTRSASSISEVREELAAIVLRKSTKPNADDGGLIGPWWVSAEDGDVGRGEFRNFQLQSGSFTLTAKEARIRIDPRSETFSFDLHGVILLSVADGSANDGGGFAQLTHFVLGPVPLNRRILPDQPKFDLEVARGYGSN